MTATATTPSLIYDIPEVTRGTTTSWIPLTTAWPSSSGCASSFFLFPEQPFPVAWDPGYGYFFGDNARCLPPAATTWWEQNHQGGDDFTVISIRPIVCPSAFTTAATSVLSGSSTEVLCCPSDYTLEGGQPGRIAGQCQSSLTSGQTITYVASLATEVGTTSTVVTAATAIRAIPVSGWNVATPSTSLSGSACSSTSTSINNTTQSCTSLSAGAKGGIGASAAIGVTGIIAFIIAIILFRRRPKPAPYSPGHVVQEEPKYNVYDNAAQPGHTEVKPFHEMSAQGMPTELPTLR